MYRLHLSPSFSTAPMVVHTAHAFHVPCRPPHPDRCMLPCCAPHPDHHGQCRPGCPWHPCSICVARAGRVFLTQVLLKVPHPHFPRSVCFFFGGNSTFHERAAGPTDGSCDMSKEEWVSCPNGCGEKLFHKEVRTLSHPSARISACACALIP